MPVSNPQSFPLAGLKELLPQWTQKLSVAESTKKSYRHTVAACLAWLQERDAPAFSGAGIEAWMQKSLLSKSSGLKRSSAMIYRGLARNFLAWLEAGNAAPDSGGASGQERTQAHASVRSSFQQKRKAGLPAEKSSGSGSGRSFPVAGLEDLLPHWMLDEQCAASTKIVRRRNARICLAWLQAQNRPLDAAGIDAWVKESLLSKPGFKPKSATDYKTAARHFLAWLEGGGASGRSGRQDAPAGVPMPKQDVRAEPHPAAPECGSAAARQGPEPAHSGLDAERLRPVFSLVRGQISRGLASLRRPMDCDARPGAFFFSGGDLIYAAAAQKGGQDGGADDMLRIVCETGEETDVLRSAFIETLRGEASAWLVEPPGQEPERLSGRIYAARSLSPAFAAQDFGGEKPVKIGFAEKGLDECLAGASGDPEFLCAPAAMIAEFRCRNVSRRSFEAAVQDVFGSRRLDFSGSICRAHGWFLIRPDEASAACRILAAAFNAIGVHADPPPSVEEAPEAPEAPE